MNTPLLIHVRWDHDAKVWIATSDDIPGLATEAADVEKLREKLHVIVPELLKSNGLAKQPAKVPIELVVHFEGVVSVD